MHNNILFENTIWLNTDSNKNQNANVEMLICLFCINNRAVKPLIAIYRIQNKSLCLHNICGCSVYNYFYGTWFGIILYNLSLFYLFYFLLNVFVNLHVSSIKKRNPNYSWILYSFLLLLLLLLFLQLLPS